MITLSDNLTTLETGNSYIIVPQTADRDETMNRFGQHHGAKPTPYGFRYSSGKNTEWLSVSKIRELITKHVDSHFSVKSSAYS
jgi:hypothetical protein